MARSLAEQLMSAYSLAQADWAAMDPAERAKVLLAGGQAPHSGEAQHALKVAGDLQAKYGAIVARSSLPVESIMEFISQVRAAVCQYVPEPERQRALLDAIASIQVK